MTAALAMPFITSAAAVAGIALGARTPIAIMTVAIGSAAMAVTVMAVQ